MHLIEFIWWNASSSVFHIFLVCILCSKYYHTTLYYPYHNKENRTLIWQTLLQCHTKPSSYLTQINCLITSLFRGDGIGGGGSKSLIFSVIGMYKAYTAQIFIEIKKYAMHNKKLWTKQWNNGPVNHLQSIYIATDRRYMKALTEVQWRLYF